MTRLAVPVILIALIFNFLGCHDKAQPPSAGPSEEVPAASTSQPTPFGFGESFDIELAPYVDEDMIMARTAEEGQLLALALELAQTSSSRFVVLMPADEPITTEHRTFRLIKGREDQLQLVYFLSSWTEGRRARIVLARDDSDAAVRSAVFHDGKWELE